MTYTSISNCFYNDNCSTVVNEFDCEVDDPGSYPWAGSFNVLMFKVILNAYMYIILRQLISCIFDIQSVVVVLLLYFLKYFSF